MEHERRRTIDTKHLLKTWFEHGIYFEQYFLSKAKTRTSYVLTNSMKNFD